MTLPNPKPMPAWKKAALPLLGKVTDVELAKQVNATRRQVAHLRVSMKIEALCKTRWRGETSKKIGVVPDKVLADELKVSVGAVKMHRQSRELRFERYGIPPEALPLLGKITDAEMARRFGRSDSTVRAWRYAHNIPAKTVPRPWLPKEIKLLGTMPDAEVARMVGRRSSHVKTKRERLKIPPYTAPQ